MAESRMVVHQTEVAMTKECFHGARPSCVGWWKHSKSLARRYVSQGVRAMSVEVSANVGHSKNQNKSLN